MENNNPKKVQVEAIKAPSRKHESASKEEKRSLLEQKKVVAIEAKERKYRRKYRGKKGRKRPVTVSAVPGKKNTYISIFENKTVLDYGNGKKYEIVSKSRRKYKV